MITSIFSIFDPSVYRNSFFFFFFFFSFFWCFGTSSSIILFFFLRYMFYEITPILSEFILKGIFITIFSFITFILIFNLLSLFPFVFTFTGHLFFTIGFSLSFFLSFLIFFFLFNSYNFFCHLVPIGTPYILIPFIVFVELLSYFIRPVTLSVRLISNLVAGHLLLGLLGSFSISNSLGLLIGIVLVILEISVCFIQAYVFVVLISLYSVEVH